MEFLQPDEIAGAKPPVDLFVPVIDEARLDPEFIKIAIRPEYASAKLMINEVFRYFHTADPNFISELQTLDQTNRRLWELQINTIFLEQGFAVSGNYPKPGESIPDFKLEKNGQIVGVEVVTSNPNTSGTGAKTPEKTGIDIIDLRRQHEFFAIKIGSPLFSKQTKTPYKKHYWEQPGMEGKPFMLALAPFHSENALNFTYKDVGRYLYGKMPEVKDGVVTHRFYEIKNHYLPGQKTIPSGFFYQPGAENISAVIFSNAGNMPKFSRMGFQSKMGRDKIMMMAEIGSCIFRDNQNTGFINAHRLIGTKPLETWSSGNVIFHNPNAVNPLPLNAFNEDIIQFYIQDNVLKNHGCPAIFFERSYTHKQIMSTELNLQFRKFIGR